ncbi:MAG: PrsW family glutamic-type intramembrane protease [Candidatus Gracilibacteria bacterium]|nr:PrsW family glutamic-type intramembrane protease [Candidatus Gracilibacteria bacterium]
MNKLFDCIKIYLKNIVIFLIFAFIFVALYEIMGLFPFLNETIENALEISGNVFDTLKLLICYYLVIGLLEESSKHFNFLASSLKEVISIKKGVLYSIFIALGFGFIENIFYVFTLLGKDGLSSTLVTTFVFRSIFSVSVHVICSVILGYFFSQAFLKKGGNLLVYTKIFFSGIIFSILVHGIFDILLTLGFTMIIFIYFVFNYMYTTKIFYKEEV